MSIEQSAQRPTTSEFPQEKEQSIFDFYSVENEIKFVQEVRSLSIEDQGFYVTGSVLRFLNEYAGKLPYNKISFLLKPGGLEFSGIQTTPVYYRTAMNTEALSRERDEWIGYREIEEELLKGTPGLTWINPPKDANYSLIFHFQKDPNSQRVDEYVLRYNEPQGEISVSQEVLSSLQPTLAFMSTSAFLRHPLRTSQPDLTLEGLLLHLGIDNEEIEKSKLFEEVVKKRMLTSIKKDYFKAISEGDKEKAEELLTGYYNWAVRIKNELDSMPLHIFQGIYRKPVSALNGEVQRALAYFSVQKATVLGGGSCPVTRAGNSTPLSSWNIYQNLKKELPIEATLNLQTCEACQEKKSTHFHCPGCGESIESGRRIETCPNCSLNKDDYAKRTGISC